MYKAFRGNHGHTGGKRKLTFVAETDEGKSTCKSRKSSADIRSFFFFHLESLCFAIALSRATALQLFLWSITHCSEEKFFAIHTVCYIVLIKITLNMHASAILTCM